MVSLRKALKSADLIVSPELLEEYRSTPFEILKMRKISHDQFQALLSGIGSFVVNAKVVVPRKRLALCRDESDNMILECCLEGAVDYLVTGDKDLLEVVKAKLEETLPRLRIITAKDYVDRED